MVFIATKIGGWIDGNAQCIYIIWNFLLTPSEKVKAHEGPTGLKIFLDSKVSSFCWPLSSPAALEANYAPLGVMYCYTKET